MIGNTVKNNMQPKELSLFLTKPDKTTIAKLKHIKSKNYDLFLEDEVDTISFIMPYYIRINNKLEKNPHIDKVKEKFMVKAKFDGDEKFHWFIIEQISKVAEESDDLRVVCYSSENQLAGRQVIDYEATGVNCLMATNDVLKDTGWKAGYINPDFNLKYRSFEISQQTKLSSIFEIKDTFDAKVIFDTEEQTVNYYKEEEISKYKGFKIGYGKYIQNVSQEIDASEIVTRLHIYGNDGLTINSVNPTGKTYIDDFSFYLYPFEIDKKGNVIEHSNYMSDDLAKALVTYNEKVSRIKTDFSDYLAEKRTLQEDLTKKNSKLIVLENELQIILDEISINKTIGQSIESAKKKRNDKNKEIKKQKSSIKDVEGKIENLDKKIEELNNNIDLKENLNEEQHIELQKFIHEDEWTDENQYDENDLYEAGMKEMSEINKPPINLTTSLVNFYEMIGESHNWERLLIGDIIEVEHKPLGIDVKTTLSHIGYNFDDKSIEVTASNTEKPSSNLDKIVNAHYTIDKVETDYNKRKINWKKVAYNYNVRNDRIDKKPTNPSKTSVKHKENDDSSVNLILKWNYPDYEKTEKKADNIDGFLIYLYYDDTDEPYQFGSKESSETIVDTPYMSRTYTFPSVPANLYYTLGIRAYRRVDEDINRKGILYSDLVRFGTISTFDTPTFRSFSSPQLLDNLETDEDGSPLAPYQPSPNLNFKGLVNGMKIVGGDTPPDNPSLNEIWFDQEKGKWYRWNGEKWVSDIEFDEIQAKLEAHKKEMEEFSEQLNKELEEANEELEKAMEELDEEMKRIEEEVIPDVERAIEETEIPSGYEQPDEIPKSGLWWDESQDPPRLMRWNDEEGEWGTLAPDEEEIEDMMDKMREEAVVESKRYSKIDIIKTRNRINEQLANEIGDVNAKIEELEEMAEALEKRAEEAVQAAEDLIEEVEGWGDLAEIVDSHSSYIEKTDKLIKQTVEKVETTEDRVTKAETSIKENAELISLAATKKEVEHIEGEMKKVTDKYAELSVTAEEIKSEVGKMEVDLDGRIKDNATAIKQTAEAINARLESFETDYIEDKTDILSSIEKNTTDIEATAKGLELRVTKEELENATEDYDRRIAKTEATLDVHAESISQKAEKSELKDYVTSKQYTEKVGSLETSINGITGTVKDIEADVDKNTNEITSAQSKISSLEVTADDITTQVSDIKSDVTTAQKDISKVEQKAGKIESTVSSVRTDLDATDKGMKANETRIKQLPDEIDLAVKEGIGDLQIGGRNLLQESTSDNLIPSSSGWITTWTNGWSYWAEVEPNKVYTVSRSNNNNNRFRIVYLDEEPKNGVSYLTIDSQDNELNHTFTTPDEATHVLIYLQYGEAISDKDKPKVQLEKGNKATDWSPAPEDGVNKTNVLSSINLSKEGVKIEGNKIDIKGLVTVLNADGSSGTMINGDKLVNKSITTNQIDVNQIFGNSAVIGKIQSDSVKTASLDAGKITAGTLNAARIGAESISASKLAANAVTAKKIAANAVTADKIHVNNVFGDKAVINKIQAESVKTSDLTASQIKSGTIDANNVSIANNRVSLNKNGVTVRDSEFLLEDGGEVYNIVEKTNFVPDPYFEMLESGASNSQGDRLYINISENKHDLYQNLYWYPGDDTTNTPLMYMYEPSEKIGGEFAGKMSPPVGVNAAVLSKSRQLQTVLTNNIAVMGLGETFTVSAYVKKQANLTPSKPRIRVYVYNEGVRIKRLASVVFDAPPEDHSHKRIHTTFTTPSQSSLGSMVGTAYIVLEIGVSETSDGFVQYSGVQVIKGDTMNILSPNAIQREAPATRSTSARSFYANNVSVFTNQGLYLRAHSRTNSTEVGTNNSYIPHRASSHPTSSAGHTKQNIVRFKDAKEMQTATDLIMNLNPSLYNINTDVNNMFFDKQKLGLLTEEVPPLLKDEDGVDPYSITTLTLVMNQEQEEKIRKMQKDIENLEMVINLQQEEIDILSNK